MKVNKTNKRNLMCVEDVPAGLVFEYKENKPCIMLGEPDPDEVEFLFEHRVYAVDIYSGEIVTFLIGTEVEVFPDAELDY